MPGLHYDSEERYIECSRRLKPAFKKEEGIYQNVKQGRSAEKNRKLKACGYTLHLNYPRLEDEGF